MADHDTLKVSEMWTNTHIDRLTDDSVVPEFWIQPCVNTTYALLNSIFERLKERGIGLNQHKLTYIVTTLKPQLSKDAIPAYFNLTKKLKSKRLNLQTSIPWMADNVEIGPMCKSQNINIDFLEDKSLPEFNGIVTNGVILELRNYWWRKQYTWRKYCSWLNRLGVCKELSEENVRQKVNSLQQKHIKLSKFNKAAEIAILVKQQFPICEINTGISTPDEENLAPENLPTVQETLQPAITEQGNNSLITMAELNVQISNLLQEAKTNTTSQANLLSKLREFQTKFIETQQKLRKIKKNFLRKEDRRNTKISNQQTTITALKDQLSGLKQSMEDDKVKQQQKYQRTIYVNSKNQILQKKLVDTKMENSMIRQQLKHKNEEVNDLMCKVEEMMGDKFRLQSKTEGKYTADIRQTVMALGSLGLGTKNISKVLEIVSTSLFGTKITELPSETTVKNFLMEANIVGKYQVCEALLENNNNTLYVDGTSDHQRHFFAYQVATKTQTYAMAVTETVHSDTTTQFSEFSRNLKELAILMGNENVEQVQTKITLSIKNMMTDQHVVNKKFKGELEGLRLSLLEKSEANWNSLTEQEQSDNVRIHQWFCFLHVLLGFTDATEEAMLAYESILTSDGKVTLGRCRTGLDNTFQQRSASYEAVKAACSLLTPSGHPAAGVPADFRAWMTNQQEVLHFVKFQHNRFNVTFHNSSALYHHHHQIIQFLEQNTQTNLLITSVLGDITDKMLMACIRGIALIHIFITGPFHSLILKSDKGHILDLNPHLVKLRLSLEEMSATPWCIMEEDYRIWDDIIPQKHALFSSVFPKTPDEMHLDVTMEVVSLVATYCIVTYSRQVSTHLPGGEHADDLPQLREESQTVVTSNSIGESQFAFLKYLRQIKPNANVESLEGSIMWAYNKTVPWLKTLPPRKRQFLLESARTKQKEFQEKWSVRRHVLRQQRLENLRQKEQTQKDKETRQTVNKQKNLDEVHTLGGQCMTEADVDQLWIQFKDNKKELIIALKAHIRFYKNVINPPGVDKMSPAVQPTRKSIFPRKTE